MQAGCQSCCDIIDITPCCAESAETCSIRDLWHTHLCGVGEKRLRGDLAPGCAGAAAVGGCGHHRQLHVQVGAAARQPAGHVADQVLGLVRAVACRSTDKQLQDCTQHTFCKPCSNQHHKDDMDVAAWSCLFPEQRVRPPASQAEHSQPVILYPAPLLGPAGLNIAPLLSNLCGKGSRRQHLGRSCAAHVDSTTAHSTRQANAKLLPPCASHAPSWTVRIRMANGKVTHRTKAWP